MFCEPYLTSQDAVFLGEVRDFLDNNLTDQIVAAEDAQRSMVADTERGDAWVNLLRPRKWHVGHWPKEYGGADLTKLQNYLLNYEMGVRGTPFIPMQGLSYIGPTVIHFGSPEQKRTILPALVEGRDTWCQGFSEPGSGSDLASVSTFAERRGDSYVINGTKIWTTDGHHADKIFVLVKTDKNSSRDGISFLMVDMNTPGISVSPIRLMTGDHDLNQIFFDEVEVPVDSLLGNEGGGWAIAKYLLEIERGAFVFGGRLRRRFQRVLDRAISKDKLHGAALEIAKGIEVDLSAYECTELRLGHVDENGSGSTADASLIKIEWSELLQRIDRLGVQVSGLESMYAESGSFGATNRKEGIPMPGWISSYFNNLAATIYGGSNEIQRNLIYRDLRKSQS